MACRWLEAMTPSSALAFSTLPRNPVRMAMLYMPNGVNVNAWTPQGAGRDFQLSPTLEPLQDLKNDIVVVSNLWNEASKGGDGHYVKEAAILTCTTIKKTQGADLGNGISMDQVAARALRGTDTASLARTWGDAGGDRRGRRGRLHAGLWLPHRLEQPYYAAGQRTESAIRLRAAVSSFFRPARQYGQNGYCCCWIAFRLTPSGCAPRLVRRTDYGWTNTCR